MEEWMQYARDMAKAEKELEIELWVIISFYRTTEQGGKVLLFRYDLPRKVADKYDWVVRWRMARLTCQYPKGNVTHTYCLYDRHSGEDYSFGSCLSSLAAAKAQVTRMERRIREYTAWQKQNNLFFDEQTDEMLQKAVAKLKIKKKMYRRQKEGCKGKPKNTNGKCGNSKTNSAFPFLAAKIAVCRTECARQPCGQVDRKKIILATLRYFFPSSLAAIPDKRTTHPTRNKNARLTTGSCITKK